MATNPLTKRDFVHFANEKLGEARREESFHKLVDAVDLILVGLSQPEVPEPDGRVGLLDDESLRAFLTRKLNYYDAHEKDCKCRSCEILGDIRAALTEAAQ